MRNALGKSLTKFAYVYLALIYLLLRFKLRPCDLDPRPCSHAQSGEVAFRFWTGRIARRVLDCALLRFGLLGRNVGRVVARRGLARRVFT